ncbi:hypothetical protein LWP59_07315 [Amycolatopsis acidiphila]|uniref:Nucleotidyltransferase domain-containing protein n=1 Tax=Amycolatopsis acidiphila TaxID=715473 RepID=A0A558A8K1_9PSEU|nr:hypothetical protein [Amycolatopsis acidiphila]TVT20578.1 hypothetical protein FNH06_19785 [Amycolatopsis acidiphila]UIJ61428.1 hypothetical protein LWP59_07315 [Amycolatopsis acidiphila]GHG77744.1 hypothetical protein GCM10017788_44040 [Amycolatopsis acidiphila]
MLRGSLASGAADAYSDIDLAWTVPGESFGTATREVASVVSRAWPVTSVRVDPDTRDSGARRLLFFWFRDLPLFWRLDLEIVSAPPGPDVPGHGEWSPAASALANAVAAVKAVRRNQPANARGLLDRGFARVGAPATATGDWLRDVVGLAEAAALSEPAVRSLADQVRELAGDHLS